MERKQHGKGKARESNYRMNPKGNEHSGTEWSGPDFLGEMHSAGGRDTASLSDKHDPKLPKEPITRSSSLGGGRAESPKGTDPTRREAASAPDGLVRPKGHFKPFSLERPETRGTASHMSTNRYFSLMARENFMENDGEVEEDWEETLSHNEDDDEANPALMEAETSQGGNDLQTIEFQGGPSNPPGTNSSC